MIREGSAEALQALRHSIVRSTVMRASLSRLRVGASRRGDLTHSRRRLEAIHSVGLKRSGFIHQPPAAA